MIVNNEKIKVFCSNSLYEFVIELRSLFNNIFSLFNNNFKGGNINYVNILFSLVKGYLSVFDVDNICDDIVLYRINNVYLNHKISLIRG